MDNQSIVKVLMAVLAVVLFILFALIGVYVVLRLKEKKKERENSINENGEDSSNDVKKPDKEYTKESIFDFMEFKKIEDNMIVQKKGKYLMVIECQGINFDLMPEIEKVSVEQGFVEFLNTLRYPIQLHIQTRMVNLEQSIRRYKQKLEVIENNYNSVRRRYQEFLKSENYDEHARQKLNYELVKQRNLYEYTRDIITNIEKTSANSNVLNKKYYVIIPYYQSEIETENYSEEEIQNMAFSELYTRAKSIIGALYGCQVMGKILDSEGLVDLLYNSYNRDEADLLSSEKAMAGGYEELYSTAEDVLDKKMRALDQEANRRAEEYANSKIEETKKEKELRKKQENLNNLVMELAQGMLEHDKSVIGEDIAEAAIASIEKDKKSTEIKTNMKGGNINENVQAKGKRGRPRKITA